MAIALPRAVANLIGAVNDHDIDRFMACFTDVALVNDKHRSIAGRDRIRTWAAMELCDIGTTYEILDAVMHHGDAVVTVKVSGGFDKPLFDRFTVNNSIYVKFGPMPVVVLSLYCSFVDDRIDLLVITPVDGSTQIATDEQVFYVPAC